jgi:alpha-L-rhamnosidase
LLNQLQHNIQWGQKGNFVDVPTDCPQRDERLGWTGDAQAFARTAAFNMHVASFFSKWLKDLSADQTEEGRVPFVIPNVLGPNASASAGWADAATIIPWTLYMAYGDKRFLEDQYQSMKAWVGFIEKKAINNLWNTGFHFGDWLFYQPADDRDGRAAVTDKYLIAQCFWAHSTQLMINTATVLNKKEDVAYYTNMLKKIKDAFIQEYTTGSGRLVSSTQTGYVLALQFDMLPENMRQQAAERLAQNIKAYGNHLTTGFLGTPYLCEVLTKHGHNDLAYTLLMQETYPSWLYPVKMGATTIWERWDGIKTDSTFQTVEMNSFNHYAYGAIGDWMYRTITGIQELSAGYKEFSIAPKPGGKLTQASGELLTDYGLAKSSWTIENGVFKLDVIVPPNTSAQVVLPNAGSKKVTERSIDINKVKVIKDISTVGADVKVAVGSGAYHFEYPVN